MVERIIRVATAAMIGFLLIHFAFVIFAQTGHDIRPFWVGAIMFGNAACAIMAWLTLSGSLLLRGY